MGSNPWDDEDADARRQGKEDSATSHLSVFDGREAFVIDQETTRPFSSPDQRAPARCKQGWRIAEGVNSLCLNLIRVFDRIASNLTESSHFVSEVWMAYRESCDVGEHDFPVIDIP
jgi:hypothetical protein